MNEMIAFCGLNCTACPSFEATLKDDDDLRAATAAWMNKKYGFNYTPDQINCDGCLTRGGRLHPYCRDCAVRACGLERDLPNCTACSDQPCEKLSEFHKFSPDAKKMFLAHLEKTAGQ